MQLQETTLNCEETTPHNLTIFDTVSPEGDIAVDMGSKPQNRAIDNCDPLYVPVPKMLPDLDYAYVICTLNEKQRTFLIHVIHSFKVNNLPIYHCVLGGAGVDKSRLIQAIYQSLLRLLNKPPADLESPKILLCAPTGKAAFNINGTTLHSAFVLPLSQCSHDLAPLSSSTRNTLFTKLRDVKLIIIHEVSGRISHFSTS